ncbi:MAG: hypothetical protein Q7S51_04715 [Gallionellaceae bacterium]|nr:hypothetical protein [Gallionellaceae bacterium]
MLARRIAMFSLLMFPAIALSDDFVSLAEARKISDKVVLFFKQEKIADAYGLLKPYWPIPVVEVDSMANQTNIQWPMLKQRFGTSIATEFVKEEKVGESLARYVYLHKFQNHAVRWVFTFYKPNDRWVINSVTMDDRIGDLFDN